MIFAALIAVGGGLLMLLSPHGCLAVPLAAGCLWPWPEALSSKLAKAGLDRRRLTVLGSAMAAVAAAVSLVTGGQLDGHLLHGGDFQTYWVGATVGARYGWSHLFDRALQFGVWTSSAGANEPFLPFLNTPPTAWLVAPLLVLPYPAAYGVWVATMATCGALVVLLLVPRSWLIPSAIVAAGLWVTPYALASGQNAVLEALAVALTWRLLQTGHESWAGVALAVIAVRPNASLLLPVALLFAGYRRTFLVWLGLVAVIASAGVLSLGGEGLRQFAQLAVDVRRSYPHAVDMTIVGLFGTNLPVLALEALLAGAALVVAWRGGRVAAPAVAAGVLASLFVTPYVHFQDYLVPIVAAVALAASAARPTYLGALVVALLAVAPPGWIFGGVWEGAVLAVEVSWLAGMGYVSMRRRETKLRAPPQHPVDA